MVEVILENLTKDYGTWTAVKGIDLHIKDKEFLVLVGPSGCGKSTTLRMIAGLEPTSGGAIRIGGRQIDKLPPWQRDIAMVFQSYALYPHMTVFENMSFGLKLKKLPAAEIKRRVEKAAKVLGLGELLARRPKELSGGQRQRVAMGRAMVRDPQVFLFDEPLSNLDAQLRLQMRTEIKRMHNAVRTTTIYVTHDQAEAMTLADRIVVMNNGRIEQIGTPQDIYHRPATRFVAGFIGSPGMNFVGAQLVRDQNELTLKLSGQQPIAIPGVRRERYEPHAGKPMVLGIRPEHLYAGEKDSKRRGKFGQISLVADLVENTGLETLVYARLGSDQIIARSTSEFAVAPGEAVSLGIDLDQMHLIDPDSGLVV